VAAIAIVLTYRTALLIASRLWERMPVAFFAPIPPDVHELMDLLARHSYLGLIARQAPLCMGVLAALAVSDVRARHLMAR
jgi:hypothetical protein